MSLPCKPEAQARGIRVPIRQAIRIPLLALRAWMDGVLYGGLGWTGNRRYFPWPDARGGSSSSIVLM